MTLQWPLIMTSKWVMTLLGIHIVARDILCDITMSNDVVMVAIMIAAKYFV